MMAGNKKTESARGAAGCALSGCGAICLIFALLFGLVGLMKLAQSERPTRSIEYTTGNFSQKLQTPIDTSLANIKFPVSSDQSVQIDPRDHNKAMILSMSTINLTTTDEGQKTSLILKSLHLVRSGSSDAWHLSSDDISQISNRLTDKDKNNQNAERSHIAFIIAAVLLAMGIAILLAASGLRR